jgi:RNA polymerase sigma-70 factor, ECF subfamily
MMVRIFQGKKKTNHTGPVEELQVMYDRYAPKFLGLCYRYCGNREDAEDIMHDGFLNILRNLERFQDRGEGSMEAWMKKIMVNTALKYLRDNAKYKKLLVFDPDRENADIREMNEEESYPPLTREHLLQLITELPLGYRTVFNFYVMEDYSHKEIAELLNISENTSKTQLSKARSWLQKRINEFVKNNQYEQSAASAR